MKAVIRNKYGGTEKMLFIETPIPEIVEDKILIKIHAASINQLDVHMLKGTPFFLRFIIGLFKPKYITLGSDVSGIIEKIGSGVKDFNIGNEVFGQFGYNQEAGYSEYGLISPRQLTHKPKNVTHSEAASVSIAGLTALQGVRLAEVKEGSKVLIYGASGGVGTFMIQVAKYYKAHVTAVVSTRNIDVAKASGADVIIDYKKTKWYKDNEIYDVILACNGSNKLARYRDALKNNGKFVSSGGDMKQTIALIIMKPFMRKKQNRSFQSFLTKISRDDLDILSDLLEKKYIRPHIDKEFSLKNTKEAFDHFINNKTIGKTIIKIVE